MMAFKWAGRLALAALSIFLLAGCVTQINDTMASWVDSHESELIAEWGPPQQRTSDGRGGSVLIYSTNVLWNTPGNLTTNGYGGVYYQPATQSGYTRQRMFYVDAEGYIYSWRWQGM